MSTTKKFAPKRTAKKAVHILPVRRDKTVVRKAIKKISIQRGKVVLPEIAAPKVESFFVVPTKKLDEAKPLLALALLSPLRFPVNTDHLAISTARYGGVLFMAVGALFTLFFASGSFGVTGQQIATKSQTATVQTAITVNCDDPLQYQSLACSDVVNKKPPVSFEVVGASAAALVGTVTVHATVAHANHVMLVAYSQTLNKVVELGPMVNVGGDVWEYSWNTLLFNDGGYILKAYILNFYGSYDTASPSSVTVDNIPLTADTTPIGVSTTATASTTDVAVVVPDAPTMSLLTAENANQFRFEISTPLSAKTVKMYLHNAALNSNSVLGYAYSSGSGLWRYRWDTTAVPAGDYSVKASVVLSDAVVLVTPFLPVTKIATVVSEPVVTTATTSTTTPEIKPVLKPTVVFDIQSVQPLKNIVTVKLAVTDATQIEMFSQRRSELVKKFLGQAQSIDTGIWMYQLDTKKVPNGEYTIVANIKNKFGTYTAESVVVKIANEVVVAFTTKEEERVKVLTDIATEVKKTESVVKPAVKEASSTPTSTSVAVTVDPEEEIAHALLNSFKDKVDAELQHLASALRAGDAKAVETSKLRLETLKIEIVNANVKNLNKQKLVEKISARIAAAVAKVEVDVQKTSKIIAERTNEKASLDSDKDGITDYDEVAIYKTNPFKVDTDGDGFNDGAEILSGHNPLDARSETLVAYESPQETGIVREDILEVKSIATALHNDTSAPATSKNVEAIITGKALPNSFVTLYIFSTPIVVTLKTDTDGSWNYRFDKELEDGKHQVYVGVTDNAGKIVAKSNPFSFVKEAQAFSPVSGEANVATPVAVPEKSFLSDYMIYLVLSISVVAIGLVLILLGLHLDTRQRKYGIVTTETEATV